MKNLENTFPALLLYGNSKILSNPWNNTKHFSTILLSVNTIYNFVYKVFNIHRNSKHSLNHKKNIKNWLFVWHLCYLCIKVRLLAVYEFSIFKKDSNLSTYAYVNACYTKQNAFCPSNADDLGNRLANLVLLLKKHTYMLCNCFKLFCWSL